MLDRVENPIKPSWFLVRLGPKKTVGYGLKLENLDFQYSLEYVFSSSLPGAHTDEAAVQYCGKLIQFLKDRMKCITTHYLLVGSFIIMVSLIIFTLDSQLLLFSVGLQKSEMVVIRLSKLTWLTVLGLQWGVLLCEYYGTDNRLSTFPLDIQCN